MGQVEADVLEIVRIFDEEIRKRVIPEAVLPAEGTPEFESRAKRAKSLGEWSERLISEHGTFYHTMPESQAADPKKVTPGVGVDIDYRFPQKVDLQVYPATEHGVPSGFTIDAFVPALSEAETFFYFRRVNPELWTVRTGWSGEAKDEEIDMAERMMQFVEDRLTGKAS